MKRALLTVLALLVAVLPAAAGTLTLEWPPVAGATGYDIDQSTDNGATWTTVATNLAPGTVCTGTPVVCRHTVTTPATGRPQYLTVSRNSGGRTRPQIGIVVTDQAMNPPVVPPPPPVDDVAGSR